MAVATAIREVDLASAIEPLSGLDAYSACMLVFRWRRRVVGRAFVEVSGGRLDAHEISAAAASLGVDAQLVWLAEVVNWNERAALAAATPSATIAICTRERPDDLCRALDAVSRQTHAGHDVVVVDNAPVTQATREVVERFPFARYVCEPRRGLNAARNRAVAESTGDVTAFTDDDAVPEPEWLENLLVNFRDPRVQCATGLTLPIELETDAQELFERVSPFGRGFRRRTFDGHHDNPLEVGPVGAGASMAIRRSVIDEIGGFDERLDGGMPTRSGGDHEMFVRILAAGHRIVYDPAATSWHRHRRTHEELLDTLYGYGVGVYSMWTGLLIERREIGLLRLAWSWFRSSHWPAIRRAFARGARESTLGPIALARAELRGCVDGPRAWMAANRMRPGGRAA